ncbi:MAG: trypsin-like peptidase domain-containing protein [Myxococcales bacterium]|nr:serine protease [Myxococcales bacterium]
MNRQNLLVLALVAVSFPAFAKSDKSRVVHKALRESVRVEVLVRGQVQRAASGVVVAVEGRTSYVLTNEHVIQREGLKGAASFQIVVERPTLHRLPAHVVAEGRVPDEDLALLAVDGEALTPAAIASEDQIDVGDDVVVVGAPYGRSLSVSAGIVSQLEVDDQDVQRSMKTDAPIGYGASGGGVFDVPSGKLVGLVEGYRTAKVAFGGISRDDFSFDVPMPGETFLAPPGKIRGFLMHSGIGRLAGLRRSSPMSESPQQTAQQ